MAVNGLFVWDIQNMPRRPTMKGIQQWPDVIDVKSIGRSAGRTLSNQLSPKTL